MFISFNQALAHVRPDVDASVNRLLIREVDLQNYIRWLGLQIIDTMDQRLVHIEDEHLLVLRRWQLDEFICWYLVERNFLHFVSNEEHRFQSLLIMHSLEVNALTAGIFALLLNLLNFGH